MSKLQNEYLDNIKSFFISEIFYEDPENFGLEHMVSYRQFLDQILKSRECDRIMERLENEFHQKNDNAKFTKSDFLLGYFKHIYGKPIPLNPRISPNFEAEFSQMMSPGFAFLSLNYLKTGLIHLPLTISEKAQIEKIKSKSNQIQNKSGCMLLFSIIIISTLSFFIF